MNEWMNEHRLANIVFRCHHGHVPSCLVTESHLVTMSHIGIAEVDCWWPRWRHGCGTFYHHSSLQFRHFRSQGSDSRVKTTVCSMLWRTAGDCSFVYSFCAPVSQSTDRNKQIDKLLFISGPALNRLITEIFKFKCLVFTTIIYMCSRKIWYTCHIYV